MSRVSSAKRVLAVIAGLALTAVHPALSAQKNKEKSVEQAPLYSFQLKTIDGKDTTLAAYKGKALLIVNTASLCGYTPQYASLQKLYETYKDKGFEVLAFPANNFGKQEPGSNSEIKEFCTRKFKTTFPLFEKISVKGDDIHPLYKYLTSVPGFEGDIRWNFSKFVIDSTGKVTARFDSKVDPMSQELLTKLEGALPPKA